MLDEVYGLCRGEKDRNEVGCNVKNRNKVGHTEKNKWSRIKCKEKKRRRM